MNGSQWNNFSNYFESNPKGVITKEEINENAIPDKLPWERGGHAIVVFGYTKTYYKIKNSWGPNWGDNGKFRVAKNAIDSLELADTSFRVSDLTE